MPSSRHRAIMQAACTLLCIAAFLCSPVRAQDTNWWTLQYGTRAQLLGGAVVGSLTDLSATFYNPGGLAISKDASVLLSAQAFQNQVLTLEDAGLADEDISTSRFSTAPTLFTGTLPSEWLPGQLAYCFLTRQQVEFRIAYRTVGMVDVNASVPGLEDFASELFIVQNLNENWGGATWSFALRENIGLGVTQFVGYRGQRTRNQGLAQVSSTDSTGATFVRINEFDYSYYRLITKAGLAIALPHEVTVGMAVTLPSVGLFGDGKTFVNLSSVGLDLNGDGRPDSFLASDSQEGVPAKYKSPLSVAAGAGYSFERVTMHFTMEWFNGVREYTVLDAQPFTVQTTGRIVDPSVTAELKDVVNFGVGLERHFKEHVAAYTSFITDFSAAVPNTTTNATRSTWDVYQVSLGLAGRVSGLDLTLGGAYSWGSDTVTISTFTPDESDVLGGERQQPVKYRNIKVFVGFAFAL